MCWSFIHRRHALTLLEVIVAIGLIAMLLGAMLTFFWQVIEVRDTTAEAAERMQIARQVLTRIAAELRGCLGHEELGFPIEQPLVEEEFLDEFDEIEEAPVLAEQQVPLLVGNRRHITFLTTTLPAEHQYDFFRESEDPPPAQHDLTQLSYWLWVDPEETDENGDPIIGGIVRTEKKTLNQFLVDLEDPLDVRNDLWSHELGYLEFRYFDGVEWSVTWNVTEGNSLPQLIQVTVGFKPCTADELENRDLDDYPLEEYPYGDDLEHPDRYSIIVRIPAADKFFSSRIQRVGQQLSEQLGVEGL
ncbi:MAG: type II secretion system protein J [Phycisphaerae bacterium]